MSTLAEAFAASLVVGSCDASAAFLATADPGGDDGVEQRASRTQMLTTRKMRRGNRFKLPCPSMGYILPAGTPVGYSALVLYR